MEEKKSVGIKIKIDEKSIEKVKEELEQQIQKFNRNKHYLGDVKWVLYNHICDLGGDEFTFRCGKYAYDKIKNMIKFEMEKSAVDSYTNEKDALLMLNGEKVNIMLFDKLNKKEIIISSGCKHRLVDKITVDEDDIVLYFA